MDQCVSAATRLLKNERKDLAVLALARSATVSDLAVQHGVSRKFVYQQTRKAQAALDEAFTAAVPQDALLFEAWFEMHHFRVTQTSESGRLSRPDFSYNMALMGRGSKQGNT